VTVAADATYASIPEFSNTSAWFVAFKKQVGQVEKDELEVFEPEDSRPSQALKPLLEFLYERRPLNKKEYKDYASETVRTECKDFSC